MANQNLISLEQDDRIGAAATRLSMDRREFLQFCAALATTLGLPQGADAAVAEAVATKKRPSVIWLHFQECTGCTESILRAEHPTLEKLILDVISLDYHETLFAAAGHQVEAARKTAMAENKGQYILVVEGAIPTRDGDGEYCTALCTRLCTAVMSMASSPQTRRPFWPPPTTAKRARSSVRGSGSM